MEMFHLESFRLQSSELLHLGLTKALSYVCVLQLRPPTVIGQFHTLFFGSVRMFFLGVLGFAVYGNEALHFSCDPDRRELNLYCYNQFRPITPQVRLSRSRAGPARTSGIRFSCFASLKKLFTDCSL